MFEHHYQRSSTISDILWQHVTVLNILSLQLIIIYTEYLQKCLKGLKTSLELSIGNSAYLYKVYLH